MVVFKERFVICINPDYPFLEEIRRKTKTIEGLKVTFRVFGIDGANKKRQVLSKNPSVPGLYPRQFDEHWPTSHVTP